MFSALLESAGRLHPIMVHLPIGLVVAAALVELWRAMQGRPQLSAFTPVALGLAVAGAAVAVGTGWLFAEDEGSGSDLFWHRWLGIAAAALLIPLAAMAVRAVRPGNARGAQLQPLVRGGTIGAAMLVGVVGHLGGAMVWGGGFLTAPIERAWRGGAAAPPTGAPLAAPAAASPAAGAPAPSPFASQVLPILQEHCYECHGNGKHKGDLALDDPAQLVGTTPNGRWIVHPGDAADSELIRRVLLPADDDDAMPPRGERLTAEQIAVLTKWVNEGADCAMTTAAPGAARGAVSLSAPAAAPPLDDAAQRAVAALRAHGVLVQAVSQRDAWLEVNASARARAFTDAELAQLRPLVPWIVELNLSRTGVTDEGVAALPTLPAAATVRLDGTQVGDRAVAAIAERCPALQAVNLVGTRVTDAGARSLAARPTLARVYLWQTAVTAEGAQALRAALPTATVDRGVE